MPFNNPKIKTPAPVTIGSQIASTVVVGPIKVDSGLLQGMLQTKTGAGGVTTPTAYTLQVSIDESGSAFANLPVSVTITPSVSANAVVNVAIPETVCLWVQIISGAAFAAGTATLQLLGIEK